MDPNMGTPPGKAAEALFGRTKRNVLGLLYGQPHNSFYLREIVTSTGAGTGAVQRELARLTDAGLVRREPRGREVYFTANPATPIYQELRSLVAKTTGIADILRTALTEFVEKKMIKIAFVYGSVASGKQESGSDVDLVIIGDLQLSALLPVMRKVQEELGREVNPTIYPAREFRAKVRKGEHFIRRVLAGPKIMLFGTTDELERLAG
jgi:predicted nucleotidyltransferase